MKRAIVISLLFLIAIQNFAQYKSSIKGVVTDAQNNTTLENATISLIDAKDSSLISFTRADTGGIFIFKQLKAGKYVLSLSYSGYKPFWQGVNLPESVDVDLGKIYLQQSSMLDTVTIFSRRPPVVINNDTIEFNAENFKTPPGATVEDLLKKMPGVTIEKNGQVKVNGKTINKIFVNGKEFFSGDPTIATKNLDADAVDKVQVYNKKSDQSEFTGFDDGNSTEAINLKLKKNRDKSTFGKISAASNFNNRYEANANINRFDGNKQLSFIGMANNTNRQGFSFQDIFNFRGDLLKGAGKGGAVKFTADDNMYGLPVTGIRNQKSGVAETFSVGLNYNNEWKEKTIMNGNATATKSNLLANKNIQRSYNVAGNQYNYNENTTSKKINLQQRVNFSVDVKLDSLTSLKITPIFTLQHQQSNSENNFLSKSLNGNVINNGTKNNNYNSDGIDFSNEILLRHKFLKKGRTFSVLINGKLNSSQNTNNYDYNFTDYSINPSLNSFTKSQTKNDAGTANANVNATYTEPIGKKSLLYVTANYNYFQGKSYQTTNNFNETTKQYDALNSLLSNKFKSNYSYQGGGIQMQTNRAKYNYTVGFDLQNAQLKSENISENTAIKRRFFDVLPTFSFKYNFRKTTTLIINYTTSTREPTTQQLQPVINNTDPLLIFFGNPLLKRSYNHSININFFDNNFYKFKNLLLNANATFMQNSITTSSSIGANGVQTTTYCNTNGNKTFVVNGNYDFYAKKIKSRFDVGMMYYFYRIISLINNAKNINDMNSITPSAGWNLSFEDIIDIHATAKYAINISKNSLQNNLNNILTNKSYGVEIINYLPWKIVFSNEFNYFISKASNQNYKTTYPNWNFSVYKSFLKNNRATLKFSVFDILNKTTGIDLNTTATYTEIAQYNVLQRYFLVTFSYRLNRSGNSGVNVMYKMGM